MPCRFPSGSTNARLHTPVAPQIRQEQHDREMREREIISHAGLTRAAATSTQPNPGPYREVQINIEGEQDPRVLRTGTAPQTILGLLCHHQGDPGNGTTALDQAISRVGGKGGVLLGSFHGVEPLSHLNSQHQPQDRVRTLPFHMWHPTQGGSCQMHSHLLATLLYP